MRQIQVLSTHTENIGVDQESIGIDQENRGITFKYLLQQPRREKGGPGLEARAPPARARATPGT